MGFGIGQNNDQFEIPEIQKINAPCQTGSKSDISLPLQQNLIKYLVFHIVKC